MIRSAARERITLRKTSTMNITFSVSSNIKYNGSRSKEATLTKPSP